MGEAAAGHPFAHVDLGGCEGPARLFVLVVVVVGAVGEDHVRTRTEGAEVRDQLRIVKLEQRRVDLRLRARLRVGEHADAAPAAIRRRGIRG